MTTRRFVLLCAGSILAIAVGGSPMALRAFSTTFEAPAAAKLPVRFTDQQFWKLSSDFSEPDGTFHSENLVSNEIAFQAIVPKLVQTAVPARAYVGVGSEQNFTYIAATQPVVAFIVDIRRGNLDLHLAYKALFEMSADRADFVSRLFSRKRPAGLTASSTAAQIFAAYENVPSSEALYTENLRAIDAELATTHGFALSAGDREGIEFVYRSWFTNGPDIHYELNTAGFGGGRGGPGGFPTYADLMTATDGAGRNRSYLASEATFAFLKDLESRNMVVPVVGNFGGPKALRAVAAYLKEQAMTVSAFYVSNVEQYLRQDDLWDKFCASAATMPVDATSVFIRSTRGGFAGGPRGGGGQAGGAGFNLALVPIASDVATCAAR